MSCVPWFSILLPTFCLILFWLWFLKWNVELIDLVLKCLFRTLFRSFIKILALDIRKYPIIFTCINIISFFNYWLLFNDWLKWHLTLIFIWILLLGNRLFQITFLWVASINWWFHSSCLRLIHLELLLHYAHLYSLWLTTRHWWLCTLLCITSTAIFLVIILYFVISWDWLWNIIVSHDLT